MYESLLFLKEMDIKNTYYAKREALISNIICQSNFISLHIG